MLNRLHLLPLTAILVPSLIGLCLTTLFRHMHVSSPRRLVVTMCLLWLPVAASVAQTTDDVPRATRAFAIENARIVRAPGDVIDRGTVVVRGGLIEAVGSDIRVPTDAERIDGDTLTVYAGFIDGLSHAGIPEPDAASDDEWERPARPGEPTFEQAGIQPERDVLGLIDLDDKSVAARRNIGFTAAHVVPRGQMLPGTGAVVLLSDGPAHRQVLERAASTFAQFENAPVRAYPSTTMAVMARLRDLFREAERRRHLEQQYAQDPDGMDRPPYDAAHAALFATAAGERPVFFQTENALAIHRALTLQQELGFTLALTGLHGAHLALDALRDTDVALFLGLDLPKEPDSTAVDTAAAGEVTTALDSTRVVTPEQPGSYFIRDHRTRSYEDVDDEVENLAARQRLERERYYAAPADLHAAGLRFGFSSLAAEPDEIRGHLRRMVDHGLPEEAALAALTTDGAALLELDRQLGTVETGKIANLVVTDGSYFDDDSRVVMVVVDGRRFEPGDEKQRPSSSDAPTRTR